MPYFFFVLHKTAIADLGCLVSKNLLFSRKFVKRHSTCLHSNMAKFVISAIVVIFLGYVSFFVSFGEKTLIEHIRAISGTAEAKKLTEGVKDKAGEVGQKVVDGLPIPKTKDSKGTKRGKRSDSENTSNQVASSNDDKNKQSNPLSTLSKDDKEALLKLLKEKN